MVKPQRQTDKLKKTPKEEQDLSLPPLMQLLEKKLAASTPAKKVDEAAIGDKQSQSGDSAPDSHNGSFDEDVIDQEIAETEKSIRETQARLDDLEKATRVQSKKDQLSKMKARFEKSQQKLQAATEKARRPLSVSVLSDSMAKYVSDIPHTTVQAFRGANIARLVHKIDNKKASISAKHTIVLIGTNNVTSSRSVQQIMSSFQDLITKISTKSSTNLIICCIIMRPCDLHDDPEETRMKEINRDLEALCKKRKVSFLHTYRIFLYKNKPIRSLFSVNDDGLHLNFEGTRRLRRSYVTPFHI